MTQHVYNVFADLLEYPEEPWFALRDHAAHSFAPESVKVAEHVSAFCAATAEFQLYSLQERYTLTFDLNPVCALDIGHYLFGEDYKRGLFLANLSETEAPYALGQKRQLPDYLPVLLRLLAVLRDNELRGSLIAECLLPAIEQMTAALDKTDNPYRHLVKAIYLTLREEAPAYQPRPAPSSLSILDAPAQRPIANCQSRHDGGMNNYVR